MTRPVFINQQTVSSEMWEMAVQWVSANQKLTRQIAARYMRYMAADVNDLYQEATIAAYSALQIAHQKGQPDQLQRFFRVIFKTNCIKLASGIHTVECPEIHNLQVHDQKCDTEDGHNSKEIEKALKNMTKRQRQVCNWLLMQPEPVSTPALAKEFKITRRQACRLISHSIKRIEEWRKI